MNEEIAVYIHIPFCQSKCYYCDFTSYVNCDLKIEEYIDALILEILQNSEISAVLGFVNYLLNALDDVNSWPDKALFFQSYLSYRNVYRDYMNVNSKKW